MHSGIWKTFNILGLTYPFNEINIETLFLPRVAMMVLDYHDMCKGLTNDPNGFSALAVKLLRTTGYSVLIIPHTEFKTSDKVLTRVQYLDSKLKNIVRHTNKDA